MDRGRRKVARDGGLEVITKDPGELVAVTRRLVGHPHHKKVSGREVLAMSKHP